MTDEKDKPRFCALPSSAGLDTGGLSKKCTFCGAEKPLDGFAIEKRRPAGRASRCKTCKAIERKQRDGTAIVIGGMLIKNRKNRQREKKEVYIEPEWDYLSHLM